MYVALDLETFLISEGAHPEPICVSWYGDFQRKDGVSIDVDTVIEYYLKSDCKLIFQNAKFDLGVIFHHLPELRPLLFKALDENRIHDTMIREKLYDLSTQGKIPRFKYGLDKLVLKYLGIDISSKKKGDDIARLWYSLVDGIPADQWDGKEFKVPDTNTVISGKEFYDYALSDTRYTYDVFFKQEEIRQEEGYGSMNTETLQVKADFCLDIWKSFGLTVDRKQAKQFALEVDNKLEPLKEKLIIMGYATQIWKDEKKIQKIIEGHTTKLNNLKQRYKKGKVKEEDFIRRKDILITKIDNQEARLLKASRFNTYGGKFQKKNKEFHDYLEKTYPDHVIRTKKGSVDISADALSNYPQDELIATRRDMSLYEKYKTTYVPKFLTKEKCHFQYDILKETGRTSSFVQVMPRDGGIREVFKAREGHKICTIDYGALELCVFAQTCKDLFGESKLLEYINKGFDIHCVLGTFLEQPSLLEDNKNWDLHIKNFQDRVADGDKIAKEYRTKGKPVGLGYPGGLGPETMVKVAKAQGIDLTINEANIFRQIHAQLFPEIVKYLGYNQQRDSIDDLHVEGWVRSAATQTNVHGIPFKYGYSANGRYREGCTYCSAANGRGMQSLASDGAKESIYLWTKHCFDPSAEHFKDLEGCIPIGFIHDELIVEIKDTKEYSKVMDILGTLMIEGMNLLLPDVNITCEAAIMNNWSKHEENHLLTLKVEKNGNKENIRSVA